MGTGRCYLAVNFAIIAIVHLVPRAPLLSRHSSAINRRTDERAAPASLHGHRWRHHDRGGWNIHCHLGFERHNLILLICIVCGKSSVEYEPLSACQARVNCLLLMYRRCGLASARLTCRRMVAPNKFHTGFVFKQLNTGNMLWIESKNTLDMSVKIRFSWKNRTEILP